VVGVWDVTGSSPLGGESHVGRSSVGDVSHIGGETHAGRELNFGVSSGRISDGSEVPLTG